MDLGVSFQKLIRVKLEKCKCGGKIVAAKEIKDKLFGDIKKCDSCGKPPINGKEVNLFSAKGLLF